MRFIQADIVFTLTNEPIKKGIIQINEGGEIVNIFSDTTLIPSHLQPKIEKFKGALCPGFINAHAHLELSHLYHLVPEHRGLIAFISEMIQFRGKFDIDTQKRAMEEAQNEMWKQGIVAVGDISNHHLSAAIKRTSPIYFHTFIESMGFDPDKAEIIYEQTKQLTQAFEELPHSIVPHAPYSVSEKLLTHIANGNESHCSIHNQECAAENKWFQNKSGSFTKFYNEMGINTSGFAAQQKNSLPSILPFLRAETPTLLVHNTFTTKADIIHAEQMHPHLYWCLCPNANLYIENTLPNVELLLEQRVQMVLGTDSLASNHQLSIAAEMWTLQQHFDLPLSQLLPMACINGAKFLGIDDRYGSIAIGKAPGLVLLQVENDRLISSAVQKIA